MSQQPHQQASYYDEQVRLHDGAAAITLNSRLWSATDPRENVPPFLLIHGLASALRIWDFTAPYLVAATSGQALTLDQRGHGLSDKPDTGYDNAHMVADDYALVNHFKLDRPVVVGHSWGANVALAYAATHTQEVRALVLVDGGMGDMQDRPGATWEAVSVDLAPPEYAGTPRDTFLGYYRQEPYFESIWSPELEDIILNIVELRADNTVGPRLSRANHMKILRSMWDTRNSELAEQVTCPVLMISAENAENETGADRKREGADRMQAALRHSPRAEFVAIPNSIHDIPLQRPDVLSGTILDFLTAADVLPLK